MFALAINGILPFTCTVQVREEGKWTDVAQGSSVDWLTDVATEEATLTGAARVVSQFGTILQRFGR